jgi:hypothetical protein
MLPDNFGYVKDIEKLFVILIYSFDEDGQVITLS